MAIDKDLFSSGNFQSTIQRYCNEVGWRIAEINSNRAIIKFNMNSGSTQTVFILRYDTTLEISCPSGLKFSDFDRIPHQLSSYLLKENSKYKIGFWCIEPLNNMEVFSIMHNAEISLMNTNYFVRIIQTLISKCDEFERAAERAIHG
ncbi:MAG TPA: hypothetical protein IGS17_18510 [Oscillatoriales cyanobacterium M59_W2019_021]|nr:MAG: hypothetical protein D6728_08235 [Cyanobacteria bacterium J055]HIK33974.1 hypothetical protein [Oscillatoriales cyanobacterium M4454_W2019_049]HIK52893.1 hypothetical protein [Oscillatoriales cyanobacterium M59_W2019_021]